MDKETLELLKKHFDIALETPNGIKKLRELILTLAMQGKIVPQDANDQPAGELLKEIEAEKKKLIADGKIKEGKPLPEIKPDEVPYEVPKGWAWVKLNEALDVRDGTHDTPKYVDKGYPLVTSKNLYTGILKLDNVKYISEKDHLKIKERSKVDRNDILFAMIGSIGNPVIVDRDDEFSIKNVALFKYYIKGKPLTDYIYYFLLFAQENMKAISSGAVQSFVSLNFLREYLFLLPPLAEQKRIVTKIEQLMAICDKLEAERNERNQKRVTIHTAAMNRLLSAKEKPMFNSSWQFIRNNFDELYSGTENVNELKKAILQLAVMGKLVPQDPNDEPAGELLKEIEAEKKKLIAAGKIKEGKPLPEIKQDEVPYEVPQGWTWVRLGDVFSLKSGISFSKENELSTGKYIYLKVGEMNNPGNELKITSSSIYLAETKKVTNALIPPNSIIFPKRGGAIATNKKRLVVFPICVDTNIMAITCPEKIDIFYSYNWFLTHDLSLLNTGTSVPQINNKEIAPMLIPLPPLAEQKRIVAKVDQLMKLCDVVAQQIQAGTETKGSLLGAVMAGGMSRRM